MKRLALLLFSFSAFSQTVVVDSITKQPLPFATIKTETGGFYTGENGKFQHIGDEKVKISFLGYRDKYLDGKNLSDTIRMVPEVIQLPEVTVSKTILKTVGLLKVAQYLSNLPVAIKQEIVMLVIPNDNNVGVYLKKIIIPTNKIKHYNKTDKLYKNARAMFRLNVYSLENGMPDKQIFSSEPVEFIMSEREKVIVDISNQMISLPQEGLAFGIEMLGRIDPQGNIIPEDAYVRPLLTAMHSPDYKATTYIRDVFSPEKIEPINVMNEHLARDIKNYKPQDYNLAIGLEVSK